MAKKSEIIVKEVAVKTIKHGNVDYICMTDIARMKNAIDPNGVVANWMRNRNTIEFLGMVQYTVLECLKKWDMKYFQNTMM